MVIINRCTSFQKEPDVCNNPPIDRDPSLARKAIGNSWSEHSLIDKITGHILFKMIDKNNMVITACVSKETYKRFVN